MTQIWHNPRCSKSRQTLALIQEQGLKPTIIKYLESPPSVDMLTEAVALLGIEPRQLLRRGESEYKELELANPDLTDQEIIQAMSTHPRLIERPIVFHDGKAAIGRPPESVLGILG